MRSIVAALAVLLVTACSGDKLPAPSNESIVCSDELFRSFEENVPTGDGQGHGPDIGSDEWKSVIEFKLGIRGEAGVPDRNTEAWCGHIDEIIRREQP